jgi:hypothetical protein
MPTGPPLSVERVAPALAANPSEAEIQIAGALLHVDNWVHCAD